MALSRARKEDQVKVLTEKMKNASSVILTHYLGLSVSDITKLRLSLRKENAEMKVAKKTLIQRAAKESNNPEFSDSDLPGDIACIFSFGEPTSGASVAFKFAKDHPEIQLVGGMFSGKILTPAEAKELATIPSRLQLLATFMSMCSSPLVSFASACSSPLTGFARALSEIAKKKEVEAPVTEAPAVAVTTPEAPTAPTAPTVA